MSNNKQYKYNQQGDCLVKPIFKIPNSAKFEKNRNVLIEGEVTGHAHRITEGEFEIFTELNRIYLNAITECLLSHEEHAPHKIAPGVYEIDRVVEYDYDTMESRRVAD